MKLTITLLVGFFLMNDVTAFRCYNCTSYNQQSSCTLEAPLTSYLKTTNCHSSCYKWILYSYGNEVRRGCKLPGYRPPGSSYAEYLCDHDLCNKGTSTSMSIFTILTLLATSVIAMVVTRH